MRLVLSRRAVIRLTEIADHIHATNPTAARYVQKAIRDAFDLLLVYPSIGRSIRSDVRSFVVPRLPYLIYYQVDKNADRAATITIRDAARRRLV